MQKKNISLYDFGGELRGKIRTASIVWGIVRDEGRKFSEVIRKETRNLKVYANSVQCNLTPCPQTVVLSWFVLVGKDVQLHNSLGSPRPVNELRTISASMYNVIPISCKKTWKILCKQVLHKCVDSGA